MRAGVRAAAGLALVSALGLAPRGAHADTCRFYAGAYAFVLPTEPAVDHALGGVRIGCFDGQRGFRGTFAFGQLGQPGRFGETGLASAGVEYGRRTRGRVALVGALDAGFQDFNRGGVIVEDPQQSSIEEGELFAEPSGTMRVRLGRAQLDLALGLHVSFDGSSVGVAPDLSAGVRVYF